MTLSPSKDLREAGLSKTASRIPGRRLSATHVLLAIVVALAFILNLLVLQDRSSTTLVAVADRAIRAGDLFSPSDLRLVSVASDFEGLEGLVGEASLATLEGSVVRRSFVEGELVRLDDLAPADAGAGLRSMSVPLPIEHAVGGGVSPGDRVDVVSIVDGVARFIATNLEVIAVSADGAGSIGAASSFHVVVAVGEDQALALAEAIDSGSLEMLRSTGAKPLATESEQAP